MRFRRPLCRFRFYIRRTGSYRRGSGCLRNGSARFLKRRERFEFGIHFHRDTHYCREQSANPDIDCGSGPENQTLPSSSRRSTWLALEARYFPLTRSFVRSVMADSPFSTISCQSLATTTCLDSLTRVLTVWAP